MSLTWDHMGKEFSKYYCSYSYDLTKGFIDVTVPTKRYFLKCWHCKFVLKP